MNSVTAPIRVCVWYRLRSGCEADALAIVRALFAASTDARPTLHARHDERGTTWMETYESERADRIVAVVDELAARHGLARYLDSPRRVERFESIDA